LKANNPQRRRRELSMIYATDAYLESTPVNPIPQEKQA